MAFDYRAVKGIGDVKVQQTGVEGQLTLLLSLIKTQV